MLFSVVLVCFTFFVFTLAIPSNVSPSPPNIGKCPSLRVRYEWRELPSRDKSEYLKATKCLQRLPPKIKSGPYIRSRWDEFVITHVDLTDAVHVVGHFLPWHRYYIHLQESALRQECGYRGPLPYWNWSIDADSNKPMKQSPVFDPRTGFGGDGVPGTYVIPPDPLHIGAIDPWNYSQGCVQSGPFIDYRITIGPGKLFTEHCLVRSINETYRHYLTSLAVNDLMNQSDYDSFRKELEGVPTTTDRRVHDAGHLIVGGDMGNPYSSPADPLFFLHHANLDRIWWEWQQSKPMKRLYEISGPTVSTLPFTNVTLDFPLTFNNLSRAVTVREVMSIHSEPLCYTYL